MTVYVKLEDKKEFMRLLKAVGHASLHSQGEVELVVDDDSTRYREKLRNGKTVAKKSEAGGSSKIDAWHSYFTTVPTF